MAGLAEITLVGILVTNPETRITSTGDVVATFIVAATDGRHDPTTGEWSDRGTTLLRCTIGHAAAENVVGSLTTGVRVLITGMLRQREWETTDSDQRYAYEVDVTEIGASLKSARVTVTRTIPETTSPG